MDTACLIERARQQRRHLLEPEAKAVLRSAGIPVPPGRVVHSLQEAVTAVREMGFPVVLKAVTPRVLHKSDLGLVRLGLADQGSLVEAFRDLRNRLENLDRDALILVEKMAPPGLEMIIGMRRDPQFGPVLMCGLGGVFVEVMRDVSYRVAPLDEIDVEDMLTELRCGSILRGERGQRPRDLAALGDIVLRLSRLALEHEAMSEVDLNPVLVYESAAVVVDARILLAGGNGA